nr:MAG TPA: hypothetical protein [Caudoviricetes sp.]
MSAFLSFLNQRKALIRLLLLETLVTFRQSRISLLYGYWAVTS